MGFLYFCDANAIFMKLKTLFEGIAWLTEEILFLPFDALRSLELDNWWFANILTWLFIIIGFVAMFYWLKQLRIFDEEGTERKDVVGHSFLN